MSRKILLGPLLMLVFVACLMIVVSDESDASLRLDPNGASTSSGDGVYTNSDSSGSYTIPSHQYFRESSGWFGNDDYIYIKDGYTFLGWARSSSATQADYVGGESYPLTSSADVLYAVWTSVIFDPNGGTITRQNGNSPSQVFGPTDQFTNAPGSQFIVKTYTYRYNNGWRTTTTNTTYTFTKTGYMFLGWADSPSATVPDYEEGDSFGSRAGSFTVYAVWESIYDITFDANGGSVYDGSSTTSSIDVTAEVLTTAPGPCFSAEGKSYSFSRTGYVLKGWSETQLTDNPEYTYGTAIPTNRNATLYAIWVAGITFDPNEGTVTCSDGSASPYTTLTGSVTMPGVKIEANNLTYRYGGVNGILKGWATSSSATSPDYTEGQTVTINAGCTLYAVWGPAVIFDPNGGIVRVGNQNVDPYAASLEAPVYVPSNAFTLIDVRYNYIYTGHTFLGWSTNANATQAEYSEGNILPTSETGYRLYAVWLDNEYDLTMHYSDSYEITIRVTYNEKVDLTSYMGYNTGMSGYRIVGWCVNPMNLSVKDDGAYLMPAGERYNQYYTLKVFSNVTIYPIWAKVCTVTNNGTLTINGSGCYYITGTATSSTITVNASKSPYIFIGDLDITASSTAGMTINSGASVTLTVISDSSFTGASTTYNSATVNNNRYGYAGISVKTNAALTVSSLSTGMLTAQGGDAFSSYTRRNGNNYTANDAYSGAGIGSNGQDQAESNACGSITIEGGNVYARGGSAIVNMQSTNRDGAYNRNGLYSGAGIGGTGATITINDGTVTAATGSIYGMYSKGMSDTSTYTNSSSASPWGTASEPLNPTREQGTVISNDAVVYLYGRSGGTVIVDDPVTLRIYARDGGSVTPVGSAASINIEGTTINLGGSQIPVEGLTIQIDADIVKDGNGNLLTTINATLITALKNYFTGTGTLNGRTYTVYVDENNALPHGVMYVYGKNGAADPVQVTGSEVFGTITPSTATTLGGISSATYDEVTLTLDLAEGYVYVNVLYKDGNNWRTYTPGAGESITQVGNRVTATLRLSITAQGTEHHICFAAMRATVDVNITCSYSEGEHTFGNAMVTSSTVDPYSIVWEENPETHVVDYTSGVHAIYYKSNVSYTITLMDGSNHRNIQLVTVDGVAVVPVDNGDGTYTLSLTDICNDMNINVSFRPTVKVTTIVVIDSYDGSFISKATAVIAGAGGSDFTGRTVEIDTQTNATVYKEYGYLDRNGKAQFTMADYVITYDPQDPDTPIGTTLGIMSIVVAVGESRSIIANGIPDIYTTDNFSEDAVITITLTSGEKQVVFVSNTTTYTKSYKTGTYITLPDEEILSQMISDTHTPMYIHRGYDLLHWKCNGVNIVAGSTMQVNEDLVFTAEWATTAHEYSIYYTLGDGGYFETPSATSYNVETEEFMIEQPKRAGYDFEGWTGTDLTEKETEVWVDPSVLSTTMCDRYYTAQWTAKDYTVTYDPNGIPVTVNQPKNYYYGDRYEDERYGSLPIYPNQTKDNKVYSFGGWALDRNGVNRITADTRVSTADAHSIYIIWILSGEGLYAINLVGTEGGTSVLSSISEEVGTEITLTITPDLGYTPTDVQINIGNGYVSVNTLHSQYPSYFDEFSLPGGWEEGDSVNYTFKIMANSSHMYYVKAVYETISYTIEITHIEEGTPYVSVFGTYTVKSDPVYITSATVGTYANHTFAGWTGTDIEDMVTTYIVIPTGSRGNREYTEVWYATSYAITYILNEATANSPYNHATYRTGDTVLLYEPTYPSAYDFLGWSTDAGGTNIITEISSETTGDITLYANLAIVTAIPKPTSIGTVTYDGTFQDGAAGGVGYTLLGDYHMKYAGTYDFIARLDGSHVWEGETGDAKRADVPLSYTIETRHMYIMTGSNWKIFDNTQMNIPANDYYTMGIAPADVNNLTITTPAGYITNVGKVVNYVVVSCNIQGDEGTELMQSYTFHVYPGVYVIFKEESSTVTLEYQGTATNITQGLNQMQITGAINNAQPSSVAAVVPRIRRQS